MSQLSQFSEGGFSDIIPDVDKFIEENGIKEDVGNVLLLENIPDEEENYKPAPSDFFNEASYPPLPNYGEIKFPPEQPTNLCSEEYSGPYNFEVYIIPNGQKTPWEYSVKLNKIFIGINLKFPIAFSLKNRPNHMQLYVRITPVFSQSQYFQELVHRCVGHEHPQDSSNKGLSPHIFQHIMRCSNNEARYFGDKNNGTRLNIIVPLGDPQAGTDTVREFFHFVCKNSCPLGMNRRPIEIIFTLEDQNGQVLGRRVVSVRICSCPKRDKEKEEKDVDKSNNPPSQGKKRKLVKEDTMKSHPSRDSDVDTREYTVSFNIVGKNNYIKALTFARDLMAGEIIKLEGKKGADAPFRKCFNEINAKINKLSAE